MHKVYLLLRDNKQSGPYTLEELLQLSPKPMDLIWVEGRSAGWQYPTEIESLKPFIADTPVKKKENSPAEQVPSPIQNTVTTEKTEAKPAIPESAKHIYISFPANASFAASQAQSQNNTEESPEDTLEKKAEAIRKKVQAFAEGKKEPAKEGEPEVKYNRSLDEMKEEYASWIYQQKKKKQGLTQHKKVLLFATLLIALLGSGYFIGKNIVRTESVVQEQTEPTSLPINGQQKFATNQSEKVADGAPSNEITNLASTSMHTSLQPLSSANNKEIIKQPLPAETQKELQKVKPRAPSTAGSSTENTTGLSSAKTATSDSNKIPVENTSIKATLPTETTDVETPPAKPTSKADNSNIPLPKLIEVSEGTADNSQVSKSFITVKNNSNLHINMVAVDVYYYKDDATLLQKKTVYFNNIPPKSFMSLQPPKERRATSVKYQIGLISSEKGLYYLR